MELIINCYNFNQDNYLDILASYNLDIMVNYFLDIMVNYYLDIMVNYYLDIINFVISMDTDFNNFNLGILVYLDMEGIINYFVLNINQVHNPY